MARLLSSLRISKRPRRCCATRSAPCRPCCIGNMSAPRVKRMSISSCRGAAAASSVHQSRHGARWPAHGRPRATFRKPPGSRGGEMRWRHFLLSTMSITPFPRASLSAWIAGRDYGKRELPKVCKRGRRRNEMERAWMADGSKKCRTGDDVPQAGQTSRSRQRVLPPCKRRCELPGPARVASNALISAIPWARVP
jgi:hypothetical protein